MKKLLVLLVAIPLSILLGDALRSGTQTITVTDSMTATDTANGTDRRDSVLTIMNVSEYEKIGLIITTLNDTDWVDDTTYVVVEFGTKIGGTYNWRWLATLDTIVLDSVIAGTTYVDYFETDTLGQVFDYMRVNTLHYDALEISADNTGLFENTYTTTFQIQFKGWK